MITTVQFFSAIVLAIVAITPNSGPKRTRIITGRIIACRSVDRVAQVASSIHNTELCLFAIESPKDSKAMKIVKIDYRHLGYSELTEEMLQGGALLSLRARRDRSCDEYYDQFVATAPVLRDESGNVTLSGIAFVDKFKDTTLAPKLKLKCYTLGKGDLRLSSN